MKKKTYKILLITIILLAFIVRLVYVANTPYYQIQHDVTGKNGALDYIFTIYKEGHLPTSNSNQFYHPPLHHLLSAGWLKITGIFVHTDEGLSESLQFLTLIYSMLILYVVYNIFKEFKFNKKVRLLLMLLVSFHPTMIILSGSINNDELCFLFMLWSILRLTKWYRNPSAKNTLILALTTGLSVMSKMTGALIAVPISFVFLQKLYRELKRSKDKKTTFIKYLYTYILFGLIALPIGLWYPIRNYLAFNQSLLYVPTANDALYVGDHSLFERFMPFSKEIFQLYCKPFDDFNAPSYLLKCSIFGEFDWSDGSMINTICYSTAMLSNFILIVYSLFAIIKNTFSKSKRNIVKKQALFISWCFTFLSYISVNIQLPHGCTMDFRYILLNLVIGIIFIGFELSGPIRENKKLSQIIYGIILALSITLIVSTNFILLTANY